MNHKKVGIISQVRMTSTRLPEKILLPAGDKPLLHYHIKRLGVAELPLCIATTVNADDDIIHRFCLDNNVLVHRGSEHNVLERYYEAAVKHRFDVVVRVTSDCPLIDGELVLEGVKKYLEADNKNLYYSNCHQRTFARGFDYEIFSFELLEKAYKNATTNFQREHVTPYIWQDDPSVVMGHYQQDVDHSRFRVTLDEKDDYTLIKKLIEEYGAHELTHSEIEKILEENNELYLINAHVEQKKS